MSLSHGRWHAGFPAHLMTSLPACTRVKCFCGCADYRHRPERRRREGLRPDGPHQGRYVEAKWNIRPESGRGAVPCAPASFFLCCSRAAAGPATRSPGPLFALAFAFAQPRPVCAPVFPNPAGLRKPKVSSRSVTLKRGARKAVKSAAGATNGSFYRSDLTQVCAHRSLHAHAQLASFLPKCCATALGAVMRWAQISGLAATLSRGTLGIVKLCSGYRARSRFSCCHCLANIYRSRWPAHPRSSWVSAPSRRRSAKAAKPHRHKIESLFCVHDEFEINLEPLYPKALYSVRGPFVRNVKMLDKVPDTRTPLLFLVDLGVRGRHQTRWRGGVG